MKHLKMFEDFKENTPVRANDVLKNIEKIVKYNLQHGALSKAGYRHDSSTIFDDKGPYDYLKIEVCKKENDYCYHIIFMIDEESIIDGKDFEKVHIEIQKYKLPEYKKIVDTKENVDLKEMLGDEFLVNKLKDVDKMVLKQPTNDADYKKNLQNQIDNFSKTY
jgi:hypothetical protein